MILPGGARDGLRLPPGSDRVLQLELRPAGESRSGLMLIVAGERERRRGDQLRAAHARPPGVARAEQRGVRRGGSPPRQRGAVRHAGAELERPDHGAERRSHDRSTRAPRSSACSATPPTRSPASPSPSCCTRTSRAGSCADSPTAPARRGRDEVIDCLLAHKDGSLRHFEILHTDLLDDSAVGGIVLNGRDVSERKAFEEQLAHQAFHDPVTHLANRALFNERVRHAVARSLRERRRHGGAVRRSRRLQDRQRQPRARRRRPRAARGGAADLDQRPRGRHRGPLRRRRVRDPARGRAATCQTAVETAERILDALSRPLQLDDNDLVIRASLGISIAEPGNPDRRRRADPQRRRRDVHRQGRRQGRLPAVRARHARPGGGAPGAARRPPARARARGVRAALPAAGPARATVPSPASRRSCAGVTRAAG